ncbi:MAG: septum formation initiator family protein [Desulfohalobiaceae bacterium]|nr:septum formation initiator family protein [Desulfohalobiaceae bacterium]
MLLTLNLGLALHLIWGENGVLDYQEHKAIRNDLQQRFQRLREENLDLSRRIRLLKTNKDYQELIVRQELHYTGENEILYILKPGKNPVKNSE